jgi:hypothetical protein
MSNLEVQAAFAPRNRPNAPQQLVQFVHRVIPRSVSRPGFDVEVELSRPNGRRVRRQGRFHLMQEAGLLVVGVFRDHAFVLTSKSTGSFRRQSHRPGVAVPLPLFGAVLARDDRRWRSYGRSCEAVMRNRPDALR